MDKRWAAAAFALAAIPATAHAQGRDGDIVVVGERTPQQRAISNQFRNRIESIRRAGEETEEPGWDLFLGAGVGSGPVALGSEKTRASGIPLIDLRYKNRFFIGTIEGIGAYLVNNERAQVGVSIAGGGAFSRIEKDDKNLYSGLKDLKGGLGVNVYGSYTLPFGDIGATVTHSSGGDLDGFSGSLYVNSTVPLSDKLYLSLDLSTLVAEAKIAEKAFGVTPAQAATRTAAIAGGQRSLTPLKAFKPSGAAFVPGVTVSALYRISERWTMLTSVSYQRLEGDIADSPLAPSDDSVSASVIFVRKMF